MPGNRAVAYKGPGEVEVLDTPYPEFELRDGPGVNPSNTSPCRTSFSYVC